MIPHLITILTYFFTFLFKLVYIYIFCDKIYLNIDIFYIKLLKSETCKIENKVKINYVGI